MRSATCASPTASPTWARLPIFVASRASRGWPSSRKPENRNAIAAHSKARRANGFLYEFFEFRPERCQRLAAHSPLHEDPVVNHEAAHNIAGPRLRTPIPIHGRLELIDLLAIEPPLLDAA